MKLLASLALVLVGTALSAQTIMNIHQNTGAVLEVPQNAIDSITYTFFYVYTPGPGVTDIDGNAYPTLIYGNGQEWTGANLRAATYANGDPIPTVANLDEWCALDTGAWVHYDLDAQYEDPYGKLYNWYAVADARNVCPTGWHVPTNVEMTGLLDFLGGSLTAGGKMKTVGTDYWLEPNAEATNESGFGGMGGGFANSILCTFSPLNEKGTWWSSTPENSTRAYSISLLHTSGFVLTPPQNREMGHSVRCVRD